MKKYRPYTAGFIVLYVLVALCVFDACYTTYGQITNTMNEYMRSFSLFSYLVCALALAYAWKYARTKVEIGDGMLHIVFTATIKAQEGQARPFFIFRQGNLDMHTIDKRFPLKSIVRYGYVDDLGFARVDGGNGNEKTLIFPVKEVCFLTDDGKRYHMNAGIYKPAQLKDMFTTIRDLTGLEPEGKLREILK